MSQGYVYIIDPDMRIDGKTVLKIGFTTRRPSKRLAELQTAVPRTLSLIHVAEFPDAKAAEAWLHKRLIHRKVREGGGSEFFYISQGEAISIVNDLAVQISKKEAEKALERDLRRFRDKISNRLSFKCGNVLGLVMGVASVYSALSEMSHLDSIGAVTSATILCSIFVGFPIGLLSMILGVALGEVAVGLIWKSKINAERTKLFDRYPAARD